MAVYGEEFLKDEVNNFEDTYSINGALEIIFFLIICVLFIVQLFNPLYEM